MEVVVQAQIKNGLLYRAVQKCGSQAALAEYLGVWPSEVGRWLKMQSVPRFRDPNPRWAKKYAELDLKLVTLIGVGLNLIFPEELETNREVIAKAVFMEAVVDMPIEQLITAGAVPKQLVSAPDDRINAMEFRKTLRNVLETLTPREEKIIKMRYGLDGYEEMTLEEVSQQVGVTRERIRQIEARALRLLRHPNRSRELKPYYQDMHH
jgi:RNA polymerase sigma factor (sigma-70 family)